MTSPTTRSAFLIADPHDRSNRSATFADKLQLRRDLPLERPGRGECLIKVHAVSLNYRDLIASKGQYPGCKKDLIPCSDGAAEIVEVGEGVSKWAVGDRVMGNFTQTYLAGWFDEDEHMGTTLGGPIDGMLATHRTIPDYGLVRTPSYLTNEEAATLPCAALTAWNALYGMDGAGQLLPGQTLVVMGTGGVSCWAAQLALAAGARVIMTSSSSAKLDRFKAHLASQRNGNGSGQLVTVNYSETPDWDKEVMRITGGRGAEHIIEIGGPKTIEKSFACVHRGGVISTIGGLASNSKDVPPNVAGLALWRGATLRGLMVGSRKQFEQMCAALEISQLRPLISDVFEFENAAVAYQAQWDGKIVGKVVVRVAKDGAEGQMAAKY